ncbi:MAG: hypothetical protein M4579_005081 [Chaenotheca gracillima]|nr:MAG: hypothetical protein M4579_005081 [Chaenotheca gracillima]
MASLFLPYSWQKRLLRYALSRLELLDTDALDLESLDIAWGRQSTVNLRDVGLQIKKLSSLLHLPTTVKIEKASIILLRVTIPADIYRSAIVIEVEGVDIQANLLPDAEVENIRPKSAGAGPQGLGDDIGSEDEALPTTTDLAASFLKTEDLPEKDQVEADLASRSHAWEEDELPTGTGVAFTLPDFLASFLKGISDRLQVQIRGVSLSINTELQNEIPSGLDPEAKTDPISILLGIEDVAVEGVTSGLGADDPGSKGEGLSEPGPDVLSSDGRRHIGLQNISVQLISYPAVFQSLSRLSGQSSPAVVQSTLPREQRSAQTSRGPTDTSSLEGRDLAATSEDSNVEGSVTESILFSPSAKATAPEAETSADPSRSTTFSDTEKFADASDDGSLSHSAGNASSFGAPARGMGVSSGSSRFLENMSQSQLDALDGEDIEDSLAFASVNDTDNHSSKTNTPPDQFLSSVTDPSSSMPGLTTEHFQGRQALADPGPPSISEQTVSSAIGDMDLDYNSAGVRGYADSDEGSASPNEDLSESKIFSHEEAESMYMSAMSDASPGGEAQNSFFGQDPRSLPPASSEEDQTQPHQTLATRLDESSTSAGREIPPTTDDTANHLKLERSHTSALSENARPEGSIGPGSGKGSPQSSGTLPPQDNESNFSTRSTRPTTRIAKKVFEIDNVDIWLPATSGSELLEEDGQVTPTGRTEPQSFLDQSQDLGRSSHVDVPGAFSTYATQRSVRHLAKEGTSQEGDTLETRTPSVKFASTETAKKQSVPPRTSNDSARVKVGAVKSRFDFPVGRLIAKLGQQIATSLSSPQPTNSGQRREPSNFNFSLEVERFSLRLFERLSGMNYQQPPDADITRDVLEDQGLEDDFLLQLDLKELNLDLSRTPQGKSLTNIAIGKFRFGHPRDDILSFDSGLKMRASTRDINAPADKDIIVSVSESEGLQRISVTTLPLHVSLNLEKLDETFSWFGGFSSILGLGSSMMSNTTITGLNHSPKKNGSPRRPRGVHFEPPRDEAPQDVVPSAAAKVDIRFGGLVVDLIGKECSVRVDTSALKIVGRDEAVGAHVEKVKVSGPHLRRENSSASAGLEIGNMRVTFLPHPEEKDLGQLLSLLTPSNAKYEQDDDILVDTLLRQRKQGSVLRLNVAQFAGRLDSLEDMRHFPGLFEEVAKLSSVTKYLPDDDRPGLLILGLVREFSFRAIVKAPFGTLSVKGSDMEAAHVNLPSLTAFGINSFQVIRNDSEVLVTKAVCPPSTGQELPMIMARLIGDEMEPTVKLKLCNVQVEYRVTDVLEAMGLSKDSSAEEFAANLTSSIATLTDQPRERSPITKAPSSSSSSEWSAQSTKALKLDVQMRDCVIGLNPLKLPSKALLVLTDTRLKVSRTKREPLQAALDISKASLLIIDETSNIERLESVSRSGKRPSFDYGSAQIGSLIAMGFVAVSYVSSAKASIQLLEADSGGKTSLDVQLQDNLLVIETCADSTQTLSAIFEGLSIPTPPSEDLKYRTEIVPIQDMLASLSGDVFVSSQARKGGSRVADVGMPRRSSSFAYSDPEDDIAPGGVGVSLLPSDVDDPEHSLSTRDIGDQVLLESYQEQSEEAPSEPLEFLEDHFGSGSSNDGTAHRWDSVKHKYETVEKQNLHESPLRVRVRNVHIIWNLFDGYDWQRTRDAIDKAVKEVEDKALERQTRRGGRVDQDEDDESVIGDFLFNSIYIGIPANRDPRELARQINRNMDDLASETESHEPSTFSQSPSRHPQPSRAKGKRLRLRRSKHHKIAFELRSISLDMVIYPPSSGETQSSLDIQVGDLEIFDHVPTSTWKKFATYMHDAGERESGSSMIRIKILNVKPVPELAASEMVVKVNVLPLRLHVDQDALDFITRFFEFKDQDAPAGSGPSDGPFFQRIEVNRVRLKLDYKPKTVDYAGLRSGHTTEFMNFFILDEADMNLERVIIYGISGMSRLSKTLNDTWMPDIKRNQLPNVLSGLAPVRSLVNVGGGVRDLVVIPMREYRKDGRIVRSIQKGALAFAKTTTSELAKFGAKLAIGTQTILQGAEGLLSKTDERIDTGWETGELDDEEEEKKVISLYADQPIGVVQGLRGAYGGLERDLLTARDAIIAVPGEIMESGSARGAARAVARRAPTVIFRPAIGASKAISQTLMGANNALDPQHRRRVEEKYKKH